MSDIINILPDSVANQIAAGEVIQRPASVIKELVENAVDAQATQIEVIVKNAGKTLIEVIDNGIGMSETDARLCFERHATSKIKCADDLFHLHTKGFRGEALASIAAIAQVELQTKRAADNLGTKLLVEACKCIEQNSCSCEKGTKFFVKNLFFNVPARRNFLKSDNVEFGHIQEEFIRIALVHNNIHFKLYHNDNLEYNLLPESPKQRIVSIFGNHYKEKLIPVEEKNDIIQISGFISLPEYAKKTKGEQYMFVNDRFIKHSYFHHAIVSAFEQLIPEKTYPSYFIFLHIKPENIDINIHPTKTEVKFREEQAIYKIIHATTRHSLGAFNLNSNIDFDNISPLDLNSYTYKPISSIREPITYSNENYNPFENKNNQSNKSNWTPKQSVKGWENIYEFIKENTPEPTSDTEPNIPFPSEEKEEKLEEITPPAVFQVFDDYIVGKIKSGIVLIKISAALERIFFDRYLNKLESANNESACQKLLFAETITLSPQNTETMKDILNDFNKLGFDIEEFGKNTFIINGIPTDADNKEQPQQLIEQMLETFNNNLLSLKISKKNNLAHSYATTLCRKQNTENMSQKEMQNIINELFCSSSPQLSPSGKKTCIIINDKELVRFFS